jgi:hypothetical protein
MGNGCSAHLAYALEFILSAYSAGSITFLALRVHKISNFKSWSGTSFIKCDFLCSSVCNLEHPSVQSNKTKLCKKTHDQFYYHELTESTSYGNEM